MAGMQRQQALTTIEQSGVLAILRFSEASPVVPLARALVHGGIRALEVTLTTPRALELIAELVRILPADVAVGAGTVLDTLGVTHAADAGASFVVSPIFRREMIAACHARDVAALPGCFSPTEIYEAYEAQADLIKVFPAASLGPRYFRDLRAPLPRVPLMPTGGVTLDNVAEWIQAGANAVGVGSGLFDAEAVARGEVTSTEEAAKRFLDAVKQARGHTE
jgi:2-dehydro-3-deoxyphosphogluconate aldolase / (4S)-4-hydroxy-2-oxoglutarate aldolase